ncbi:piggyBac transposable element-derived protein 4-like [Melitaea cinxia]|uniref:piggyBac transposable element-derived protein 4-like n=1 Tax=Melitaea cinxia TaxID=113334 RepID=UPI001E273A20|nr:piggyBac transposable element-derived protein 4-like [Melitaea cinxia]
MPSTPVVPSTPSNRNLRPRRLTRRPQRRRRISISFDYLQDSGSEVEIGTDDDDENEFEDYAGMRAVVRELRELESAQAVVEAEEAEPSREVGGGDMPVSFDWSQDYSTFHGQEMEYQRTPGLSDSAGTQVPFELFMLVWDSTIMDHIVKETNKYAWQTIAKLSESGNISANLDTWVETNVPEMYRYFAVLMYMSLNPRGHIPEYWATNILGMPDFRLLMSRNRFQMITRFLHFVNNDHMSNNTRSYDRKVAKITPILEHCNEKFCTLYTPNKHLSIDESLILWKGRLSWVQCIRTKAARFGIKSFEICEATTGYMLRCIIYAGKNSSMHEGPIDGFAAPTEKVVLNLMEGFLDAGHCLVMDNWYNQLPLTRYLNQRGTDLIGTLNRRRRHVPALIKNVREDVVRGHVVSCHCGDISLTVWKDVQLVATISTYHDDQLVAGRRAGEDINKPVSISEYNKYMGGVDLKDQKLSMYLLERKRGLKWYIKVFRRLLNISILNTFIMYQKHPTTSTLTHRQFRYALADGLCKRFPRAEPAHPIRQMPSALVRLDNASDHYPVHTETIRGKPTQHIRRRCVRCTARQVRTQVTVMCQKCRAPLCIGQCWIDYHTLNNL